MTEKEVMNWMEHYLDGTKAETSALGMIKADVHEYGFDTWLQLPPETVVECYLNVSDEVSNDLVDAFKAMFSQERELDELGIGQSIRLDPEESIVALRDGMSDIMRSLQYYLEVQRMANDLIEEEYED